MQSASSEQGVIVVQTPSWLVTSVRRQSSWLLPQTPGAADGLQNASSAPPSTQTLPFGSDIGVSPQPGAQKSVPSSRLPG